MHALKRNERTLLRNNMNKTVSGNFVMTEPGKYKPSVLQKTVGTVCIFMIMKTNKKSPELSESQTKLSDSIYTRLKGKNKFFVL